MTNFIWKYTKTDIQDIERISKEFSVPESIATIMSLKNINNKKTSRSFFYNDLNKLHDPLLMKDMEKAINRIIQAQKNQEIILIIGDYDTDGTSAAAVLQLYLKSINIDTYYYIPNRQTEGYGISKLAIDYAIQIGAHLLISCDCGITAIDEIDYANTKDLDFIITDHHKQKDILPNAYAILNPNQHDCDYPFKGLCGAGVAFKLCLGINNKLNQNSEKVFQYLDLVAVATTADVMPVIDENRLIVKEGINKILTGNNKGINALLNISKLDKHSLTVGKLSYWFIPKINAAGRLGDAGRAVKLFTTSNPQLANEIALDLENENEKRKAITLQNENEAINMINTSIDLKNQKIIILHNKDWHFGIVGIVASRIKELYHRPTIILTEEKGLYKGSCRSIAGYDIVSALASCDNILDNYGGHPMAAGLTIKKENLDLFNKTMNNHAKNSLVGNLDPIINIDYELKLSEINDRFIKFLNYLEPFGPGNSKPIFVTKNISGFGDIQLLGKERETLKFTLSNKYTKLTIIGFKMLEHYEKLLSGRSIDIVYTIDKNYWNGQYSIQCILKDIMYSEMSNE